MLNLHSDEDDDGRLLLLCSILPLTPEPSVMTHQSGISSFLVPPPLQTEGSQPSSALTLLWLHLSCCWIHESVCPHWDSDLDQISSGKLLCTLFWVQLDFVGRRWSCDESQLLCRPGSVQTHKASWEQKAKVDEGLDKRVTVAEKHLSGTVKFIYIKQFSNMAVQRAFHHKNIILKQAIKI